jgi:hypothetical protein
MDNPYADESRAASKEALALPVDHPGYVPASEEVWRPYETCPGCDRRVSYHIPSQDERDEQHVIAGTNAADIGLICSHSCVWRKYPQHPMFTRDYSFYEAQWSPELAQRANANPALEIALLRDEIASLKAKYAIAAPVVPQEEAPSV